MDRDEIETEIRYMIEAIGPDHAVCKGIRALASARIRLQNVEDERREGRQLAKEVITKLAYVLRRLVEYTDLIQEEDLNTGIEIALEFLHNIDTSEAYRCGQSGSQSDFSYSEADSSGSQSDSS